MNKFLLIFFSVCFLISNSFRSADQMYDYNIFFVEPKSTDAHFGISIKVKVNDGHYISSSIESDKLDAKVTEILWPTEKGCFNKLGKEFLNCKNPMFVSPKFYYEDECIENNGNWIYGNWIIDLEKYYDGLIFEEISEISESSKPEQKDGANIQKGSFEIYQEYTLVDNLESGLYNFKGIFDHQVCMDSGICVPIVDYFSKEVRIVNQNGGYDLKWNNLPVTVGLASCEQEFSSQENCELTKSENDSSLIMSFFTAIFAGLIAIVTPCVFPMIPMTVAFFSKDAKKGSRESIKTGIIFGISIIVIFTVIGVLFSAIFGAQLANELATSATANIIFAIIFLVFAISFFGYFEIRIPNKFLNKINKKADSGGLLGIFFMALTLVLVSFSCTAPIVGTVMIDAVAGNFLKPIIVMLGFSLAFAIPFSMFAIFPSWLESLPQSGGWLNTVKVILGFLELALALKFLSMPDQAYNWGILSRETFLILWIIIFVAMGLYILGYIKFQHDSSIEEFGVVRMSSATVTFGFCIYMFSGLMGGPIPALAGIIPPEKVNMYNYDINFPKDVKYSDKLHLPPGFQGFFDYEEALDYAIEQSKPLFIDFTGHACFNCRRMEENVWAHPNVRSILNNDYVIVALYVDDKTQLIDDKKYRNIGDKNFDLQVSKFCSNAQPFYVLLDPLYEKVLVTPVAYDTNVQNFVEFLTKGKKEFEKK